MLFNFVHYTAKNVKSTNLNNVPTVCSVNPTADIGIQSPKNTQCVHLGTFILKTPKQIVIKFCRATQSSPFPPNPLCWSEANEVHLNINLREKKINYLDFIIV